MGNLPGLPAILEEREPYVLSYLLLHDVIQLERLAGFVVTDKVQ